ncbi:hypothetical protein DKE39_000295 [Acinetobacter baumannii]|nr:hypothetical protein DKE39_000295 [Acinetobacter baumannii]
MSYLFLSCTELKFIYSGQGLPTNQESLFWINIQEIPPTAQEKTSYNWRYAAELNCSIVQKKSKLHWMMQ